MALGDRVDKLDTIDPEVLAAVVVKFDEAKAALQAASLLAARSGAEVAGAAEAAAVAVAEAEARLAALEGAFMAKFDEVCAKLCAEVRQVVSSHSLTPPDRGCQNEANAATKAAAKEEELKALARKVWTWPDPPHITYFEGDKLSAL